jgi:Flp pilus assembly protein TadD
MLRTLGGVVSLTMLLLVLNGCGEQGQPPSADEAARQTAITEQGAVNAPAPGGAAPANSGQ